MNDKELDDMDASKTFTKQPNRVTRVACGAGVMEIEVHALLDQYKKFSQVVKQMGGVKELFKDEKQIKNLNPAKMGKVNILIIQTNIYKSWHILSGLPEYGQGYGPPHVASHWRHAGDRGHDEADAARRRHTRGHGHAGPGQDDEEEGGQEITWEDVHLLTTIILFILKKTVFSSTVIKGIICYKML